MRFLLGEYKYIKRVFGHCFRCCYMLFRDCSCRFSTQHFYSSSHSRGRNGSVETYSTEPPAYQITSHGSSNASFNTESFFPRPILHKPASCFRYALIFLLERLEDGHRGNRLHCRREYLARWDRVPQHSHQRPRHIQRH